ncbi:hypothetical protein ACA910_003236 [Epithemia clementina (nom. ined.)]
MPRTANGLSSSSASNRVQKILKDEHHRVAIIGGGISGLSCAQRLGAQSSTAGKNLHVTVFDTGRLRPGGRMSSRLPGDRPKESNINGGDSDGVSKIYEYLSKCTFDHAAQMIPLPGENSGMQDFVEQLLQWEEQGVLVKFPNQSLCDIVPGKSTGQGDGPSKSFNLQPFSSGSSVYHGKGGNGMLPVTMARNGNFEVVQDVWVSPSNGVRYMTKSKEWKVQASGKVLGYFDTLIIAHNGKCADRLMSKTPAKRVHELLKVNFASNVPRDGGKRMTLNSLYSLTFAVGGNQNNVLSNALPVSFIAGNICNEPNLRFLSCQSRKYPSSPLKESGVEVWTVLSSAAFAKKHKAPQEFLPEETVDEVTTLLLQALERALGLESFSIKPLESRLQLWGAAVPLNTWQGHRNTNGEDIIQDHDDAGFIYDQEYSVGVCGDWLIQPSVAGAWTSGRRLADHLCRSSPGTVGLDGRFLRSEGALNGGIASFGETRKPLLSPSFLNKESVMTETSLNKESVMAETVE